jgi:alginate O-acetyltransferase complex protein AlgI
MSFNSLQFALFFPVILMLLRWTDGWLKLFILLAGNIIFLQVLGTQHSFFMLYVIATSYLAGILIERFRGGRQRGLVFLAATIMLVTAPLIYFKYQAFIICLLNMSSNRCDPTSYIENYSQVLPLGISFYTLQAISYVVDVHFGLTRCERNLLYFANFKSFFPQLVAGPIERVTTLLPQLKKDFRATNADLYAGFSLMAWGFFKKLVIADNLTTIVDPVFANPQNFNASSLAVAVLAFTIQIYCDFSGYTDIATGVARMMGIRLSINFNNPYFANSITNFWRRWHISLSTWFRDYVYLPIGGSRSGVVRMYFGLTAVFLLSGIWHGANFSFITWALIHLFFLVLEKVSGTVRPDKPVHLGLASIMQWAVTMFIVMVGWVFFRAKNVGDGFYILKTLFNSLLGSSGAITAGSNAIAPNFLGLAIGFGAALFMFAWENFISCNDGGRILNNEHMRRSGFVALYILLLITLVAGNFGRSAFIYFQF